MFERLPRELQVAVVRELGRNDLRSFRLIGKTGDVAMPELFNTLHISPSRNSYDRAKQLSGDARLARHTRAIVYHLSYVNDEYKEDYDKFIEHLMEFNPHQDGSWRKPNAAEHKTLNEKYGQERIAEFYRNCLQEISDRLDDEDNPQDRAFEEEHFLDIIRPLSRLEYFKCFDDSKWDEHESDPVDAYLSRIGLRPEYQLTEAKAGWRVAMFLGTLNLSNLRSLHLSNVSWDVFDDPGSYAPLMEASMPKLREFSLLLAYDHRIQWWGPGPFPTSLSSKRLDAFDKLLAVSTSWRVASLVFGLESFDEQATPWMALTNFETVMAEMLFQHHWPHVRSLELKYLYGGEEIDFLYWLLSHRSNLRTLRMARVMFLDYKKIAILFWKAAQPSSSKLLHSS